MVSAATVLKKLVNVKNTVVDSFEFDNNEKGEIKQYDLVLSNYNCCLVAESCPTLLQPMACRLPGSSSHGVSFPGKNTGVGCHFLLQGSSQARDL